MDTHHMHHLAETMQSNQKLAVDQLLGFIEKLLKDYKDKKKGEHKIEVKVDGKTKFKATIDKTGRMRATKNDLSASELQALQDYFKQIPNASIKPKEFDVQVDGKQVLATKNGEVTKYVPPQHSEVSTEAKQLDGAKATPAQAESTRFETTHNPQSSQPQGNEASTAVEKAKTDPIPLTPSVASKNLNSPEKSAPSVQLHIHGSAPIPEAQKPPEVVPHVNETGLVPADYGLGKPISDDAIVASGDRPLLAAHGSLERRRLELNDCVRRGSEPGMSYLNERAGVLRSEINRDLPGFAKRLDESIAQGKYNPAPSQRTAPCLDNDMALTQKKQETQTQTQGKKRVLAKA